MDELVYHDDEGGIEVKGLSIQPPSGQRRGCKRGVSMEDGNKNFCEINSMSSSVSCASSYVSESTTTYDSDADEDDSSLSNEGESSSDESKYKYRRSTEKIKKGNIVKSGGMASKTKDITFGKSMVAGKDLNWIDVGAKIGIRLLNSKEVQRAIAKPGEKTTSVGGVMSTNVGNGLKSTDIVGTMKGGGETAKTVELTAALEKKTCSLSALGTCGVDNSDAIAAAPVITPLSSVESLEEAAIDAERETRDLEITKPIKAVSAVVTAMRPVHAMRASPSGVALCDDWTDGGTDDHSSISELTLDQFCSPQNKKPVVAGSKGRKWWEFVSPDGASKFL